ncbi:MAG: alpha/beta hydrolase, partial [bacterium]|nr:alpha/beta hydrolase [bacterium]
VKNLNEFLNFLEKETKLNLYKIKTPVLIASAKTDPVIHPKSTEYILKNISSLKKEVFWFKSKEHDIMGEGCEGLFDKIYEFIKESTDVSNFNVS